MKDKVFLDRRLGLQVIEFPRICRQSAYDSDKVVSPTNQPPLPQEDTPGTRFC